MSVPLPPPLPSRAIESPDAITAMEHAFALTATADEEVPARDSEPRVGFAMWDERRGDLDVDAGLARMRREHLAKYVKATMAASLLVCVVALGRLALGGGADDASSSRATLGKMREAPAEVAVLAATRSTLTARTMAALRVEKRREDLRARTAARAKAFW